MSAPANDLAPHISTAEGLAAPAITPAMGPGSRPQVCGILILASALLLTVLPAPVAQGQELPGLTEAVNRLADLDYTRRMDAARAVRRVPAAEAVPALLQAVTSHKDEYVRYRAFVLLTSFNAPQTRGLVASLLRDRNDRLREAAYAWLARHPDPALTTTLLQAVAGEEAEFVRPALMRALAALDADPAVRTVLVREVGRGLDFFRGAVLEALSAPRSAYAVNAIGELAALDGPLQDDAFYALGRIGDPRALALLEDVERVTPEGAVAIGVMRCLLRRDCETDRAELRTALTATGDGTRSRNAAAALVVLAETGDAVAIEALVHAAADAPSAVREEIAIGLATIALRQPPRMLAWLAAHPPDRDAAVAVLLEGFDILDEDLAEEEFFAAARAEYWRAPDGSGMRVVTAALIDRLEF